MIDMENSTARRFSWGADARRRRSATRPAGLATGSSEASNPFALKKWRSIGAASAASKTAPLARLSTVVVLLIQEIHPKPSMELIISIMFKVPSLFIIMKF